MSCSRHTFWQWPLAAGAFSGVTFSEPCAASFLWIAIAPPAAPVRSPSLMFGRMPVNFGGRRWNNAVFVWAAHLTQIFVWVDSYGKISRQVVHSGFKRHSGQPKAQ
ncbi:hypothetical protein WJX79_010146 [Trebouxia sp. C0005]